MKTQFTHFVLTIGLTVTSGHLALSQSSVYFNRNTFSNACQVVPGNKQSISFENLQFSQEGPVVTISDVTFTGRYLIRSALTSGAALYNFDGTKPLSIHFANGALAFGTDFSSKYSLIASFTATLSLDNGETFQFTAPTGPNYAFFGFISSNPIRDLTFSDGGILPGRVNLHEELIGNISMVTVIPEPATIALAAVVALLLGRRCQRSKL
jgi:hypothetical protein